MNIRKLLPTLLLVAFFIPAHAQFVLEPFGTPALAGGSGAMATVRIPPLPAQLDFAGEPVPLGNFDTRESLVKDLLVTCYMHSRTMQTLLAASRWFPVIEPILRRYGVPDDFKYLCMAESGLNPSINSPAGAGGLWQIMPATAREYGLFVAAGVDERYHVEKSTEAACQYLLAAKAKLGSWTLAAASYNLGTTGIATRQDKQGVTNYYDLFLPEETMRYVFRCLTFKLVSGDPALYGFHIRPEERFAPLDRYREVSVDSAAIDWSALARQHGTSYKMLRELNPWIRDYTYTNSARRTFTVKIPEAGFRQ
jgi:hypothetical protein